MYGYTSMVIRHLERQERQLWCLPICFPCRSNPSQKRSALEELNLLWEKEIIFFGLILTERGCNQVRKKKKMAELLPLNVYSDTFQAHYCVTNMTTRNICFRRATFEILRYCESEVSIYSIYH